MDERDYKAMNKELNQPSYTNVVRCGFFGVKYLYLDEKTRVRYGFTFTRLIKTYTLQRKGIFWNNVAWTLPSTHIGGKLEDIIEYLKWYEKDNKQPKSDCLF
jgi:hypothetical protein